MAVQPHGVVGVDNVIAAQAELFLHLACRSGTVLERLDRGVLADDAGAEHGVLVDAHHRVDQFRRSAGVADAEAGHRVGLGKAVQKDRALGHPGQRRDADVFPLERQLGVNLVGDHQQVVPFGQAGDLHQHFAGHGAAGRIGRKIQNQRLALRRDDALDRLRRHGKAILGKTRHRHRNTVRQ